MIGLGLEKPQEFLNTDVAAIFGTLDLLPARRADADYRRRTL